MDYALQHLLTYIRTYLLFPTPRSLATLFDTIH